MCESHWADRACTGSVDTSACHQLSAGKAGHPPVFEEGAFPLAEEGATPVVEEGATPVVEEGALAPVTKPAADEGTAASSTKASRTRGVRIPGNYRFRFSRGRWLMTIGVPTNPNCSRSRRSMYRSYDASSLPLVNSTNVGGATELWVPNRIFGCLPPRTGCGCSETSRPRKVF